MYIKANTTFNNCKSYPLTSLCFQTKSVSLFRDNKSFAQGHTDSELRSHEPKVGSIQIKIKKNRADQAIHVYNYGFHYSLR